MYGEQLSLKCTTKNVKNPIGFIEWSSFTCQGLWRQVFIENKINSCVYQEILAKGLIPLIGQDIPKDRISTWSGIGHNSRSTKAWSKGHNINILSWAANFLDLNPMENVWRDIKFRIWAEPITDKKRRTIVPY